VEVQDILSKCRPSRGELIEIGIEPLINPAGGRLSAPTMDKQDLCIIVEFRKFRPHACLRTRLGVILIARLGFKG
jgi:hypothetical protein